MKAHISNRDWQQLSAYVDGQLGSRQSARLGARLAKEPDLQSVLDDLRLMKKGLRELPELRAPRNFTLTPEMADQAGQRRRSARLYNTFRLVSLLSSLLFVLIFLGDNFAYGSLDTSPASQELAAPAAQRSADDLQEAPAEAEVLTEAEMESSEKAAEGMADAEATTVAAENLTLGGASEEDAQANAYAETAAEPAAPDAEEAEAIAGEDKDAVPSAEAPAVEYALEGDPDILPGDTASTRPVVIIEIIFILMAIISGLLALILRRRGRI
jgi:anti-sigma factor RsiW